MDVPQNLFKIFDKKMFYGLQQAWLNSPNEVSGVDTWIEDIDYNRYRPDMPEEEVIKREVKRYEKENSYLKRKGRVEVLYEGWFEDIRVIVYPSLSTIIADNVENGMDYIRKNFFHKFMDYGLALKLVKDFDFPEHIEGVEEPSGRAGFIGWICRSKKKSSIPTLREIVLNDPSIACKYEAAKGLFYLKDKKGLSKALENLPKLKLKPFDDYSYGLLVMADVCGIKGLERQVYELLEWKVQNFKPMEFGSGLPIHDTFLLLQNQSMDAASQFLVNYYPSPYNAMNEAIELAFTERPLIELPESKTKRFVDDNVFVSAITPKKETEDIRNDLLF